MKIKRLLFWSVLVLVLDQFTKWLVVVYIPFGQSIPVIPNFFDLVHVTNSGAAFGLFGNLPDPYRFLVLIGVSTIAVILIIYYYWSLPERQRYLQIPLALVLGGAAGNIADRFFRGAVVDFLSIHWYDKWVKWEFKGYYWQFKLEWPAFNVADMAISLSVIFLLFALTREHKHHSSIDEG